MSDRPDPSARALDLSVVIPTFRRPAQLEEAIRSVLRQPGVALEVIVVDDSPERSGRPVVERIGDARVTYLAMSEPTGGNPSRVRNSAWPSARGEFLHFLDDDDRVVDGAYQEFVLALRARPGRGVAFGAVLPFGDDPDAVARERRFFGSARARARAYGRLGSRILTSAALLFTPTLLVNSTCMVRREVVAALGGYDEELRVMEDVDFYCRAIRHAGFVFLDRPFIEYRTGAPSLMNAHAGRSVDASFERMYRKYRRAHGRLEFVAAKVVAKTALRLL